MLHHDHPITSFSLYHPKCQMSIFMDFLPFSGVAEIKLAWYTDKKGKAGEFSC